jgi:hypothetical protein
MVGCVELCTVGRRLAGGVATGIDIPVKGVSINIALVINIYMIGSPLCPRACPGLSLRGEAARARSSQGGSLLSGKPVRPGLWEI